MRCGGDAGNGVAIQDLPSHAVEHDHVAVEGLASLPDIRILFWRVTVTMSRAARYVFSILSRRFVSMVKPLPVYRGDRVLIIQVLLAAFPEQDGKVVVCLDVGLDALTVDEEEGKELVFLDGLIQELLLDVGPALCCLFGREVGAGSGGRCFDGEDRL